MIKKLEEHGRLLILFEKVLTVMKEYFYRLSTVFFLICSIFIVTYVLFIPPMPGVADQGDFHRVMDVTGLKETEINTKDRNLAFFKYVKSEYAMTPVNPLRFFGIIPTTSMIYPIAAAKFLCRISGGNLFNTGILAVVYAIMYITALTLCIKWQGYGSRTAIIFLIIFSLVILFDGNYLVWFNSLYGEPMMMIGLALFIASVLNISNKTGSAESKDILFVAVSSFLFLGSKIQCITALPLVIFIIARVFSLKYKTQPGVSLKKAVIPIVLLIFYTFGFYIQVNSTCGVDTKYNSVFYGILKDSEDPERDLRILGLKIDMAVEAGKHAYLPENQYEKYVPWSDITMEEFNRKISYFKIVKFYLQNPKRLIHGMEYTASQCFQTASFLGKYKKTDVGEYTYLFDRFTLWSDIRSRYLPKKLWFIVSFYVVILTVSLIKYFKTQKNSDRLRIELVWIIAATGIFQFPMPYLGNGKADTAKQLFLFNYTFDILIIILATFLLQSLESLLKTRLSRHASRL